MSSDPVATQPAMTEAQATTTTSDAMVTMCGIRKTIVKSASAPPITQPPILSTPLCSVAPVDSSPIDRRIKDVTKHCREGDLERKVHVCGIGERVRHKKTFWFRRFCASARRVRQKQGVQHDSHRDAVGDGDPDPKNSSDQQFR